MVEQGGCVSTYANIAASDTVSNVRKYDTTLVFRPNISHHYRITKNRSFNRNMIARFASIVRLNAIVKLYN